MQFEGPDEERRALTWMKNKLQDKRTELGRKKNDQMVMIMDLSREIDDRINQIKGDYVAETEFHDRLWDRFIYAMTNTWIDDAKDNWDCPYVWGEWAHAGAQTLDIGYSEHLEATYVPRGGGSAQHYYSAIPDDITWSLTPLTQKGHTFFIGKAKVAEIDAVCSVPQLPNEMDSHETGLRVLDKARGEDEWQRRVEAKRITSISNFIENGSNLIANSAILFCGESSSVSVTDEGEVQISFEEFLVKGSDGNWSDHKGKEDKRPIWLIDGQHRTRGLAQSKTGIELDIPIIFFPPDFDLSQSSKIFAEINTLQKKLSPLHTLFMQHRFSIPSPTGKRDFSSPWDDGKTASKNSRANHLSYECAAYLTSNKGGPLFNRIKILDQNSSQMAIIQASQWVDFSRNWYRDGGIYGHPTSYNQEQINKEVENYFSAWVSTCNHDGWEEATGNGKDRWCLKASPKGLIQRTGPSMSLLRLYPVAWKLAKTRAQGMMPIPREIFEKVLAPLKWVDWLDSRLKATYLTGGERGRNALRIWMTDAIRGETVYGYDEVMSSEIHSVAGKGILSSPGDGVIEVVDGKKWPYGGRPLVRRAIQPKNTLPTSRWTIIDSKKVNRSPDNSSIQAVRGVAEYTLRNEKWLGEIDSLEIRVDWDNMVSPPGKAILTLKKPKN